MKNHMPAAVRALLLVVLCLIPSDAAHGAQAVTTTGLGSMTVRQELIIVGVPFSAGQKTWNIDGPGFPFVAWSEFDPETSTFVYRSAAGATTTASVSFNNLTIAPASGSGVFGVEPQDLGESIASVTKRKSVEFKENFDPTSSVHRTAPFALRVSSPELRTVQYGGSITSTDPLQFAFISNQTPFIRYDIVRYDPEQGEVQAYFNSEYPSSIGDVSFVYGPGVQTEDRYIWESSLSVLDGVWYLEEDMGATTTARNAASSTLDATYSGMNSSNTIDGVFGRAALFQGVDDSITLPQNIIRSNAAATGSISMWFRTTASGPIFGYQDTAVGGNPGEYVPILYVGTDGKLRGQVWQGAVNPIVTTGIVNDGQWHHAALEWKTNTQSLYLDGRLVGTRSGTVNHQNMSVNQIGAAHTTSWPSAQTGWWYFNGMIDEVRVATSERYADDIYAEYQVIADRSLVTATDSKVFPGLYVRGDLTVGGGGGNPTLAFNLGGMADEGPGIEIDVPLKVDGSVSVSAGATLVLAGQSTIPGEGPPTIVDNPITFGGDFTNNGTVTASNSEVIFSPVGNSLTIGGTSNTSFGTTTINAPGKTVQLKADTTGNFTQFARAIFSGLPGLPLTLQSTSQGSKWNLNLGSLTGSSISHVAIRDGGCHAGTQRFPTNETVINLGNSDDCWGFTVRGTGSTVTGGGGTPQTGGGIFGGGTNIALNMPAFQSSNEGSGSTGPSNITDGNQVTTRWSSAGSEYPHWIYIDLGQRYSLNSARIIWEAAYPANYQIEVSDNAGSWTSIASVTGKSSAGTDTFSNLSGTGRYVRILGTQQAVYGNMSLYEFELAGTPAGGGGGAQGGGGSGGGGGAAP